MKLFQEIESNANIQEVIHSAFSMDLAIAGGWGYRQEVATILLETTMPIAQLQHTVASMRTHIEMNMTLPKEQRYAGINLHEVSREKYSIDTHTFEKVTYEISAIQEELYNAFIKEYKEGYGTKEFDITNHFQRKSSATLKRESSHWFEVSELL